MMGLNQALWNFIKSQGIHTATKLSRFYDFCYLISWRILVLNLFNADYGISMGLDGLSNCRSAKTIDVDCSELVLKCILIWIWKIMNWRKLNPIPESIVIFCFPLKRGYSVCCIHNNKNIFCWILCISFAFQAISCLPTLFSPINLSKYAKWLSVQSKSKFIRLAFGWIGFH